LKYMEFRGTDIGDTIYTTVFLGKLQKKVLERYEDENIPES